jgi:two-component sensor histidine kinase
LILVDIGLVGLSGIELTRKIRGLMPKARILILSMHKESFQLSVADQGVGFSDGFDWTKSDSLGLRLVRLLTEQLQGKILLERDHGTKFIMTFKDRAF